LKLSKISFLTNSFHFLQDSLLDESLSEDDLQVYPELDDFNSYDQKFSKSSDCYHHNTLKIGITTKASQRSDDSKTAWR